MERESMLIYKSFIDVSATLSDGDYRLFWDAIHKYGVYGNDIPVFENPTLNALMILIKPLLNANIKNYENGSKGGAPKGNQNAKKTTKTTQKQPPVNSGLNLKTTQKQGNVNVNDNVTVNVTDTVTVNDTINKKEIYKEKVTEEKINPFIDINTMSITDFDKYDKWNREHGIEEG